MKANYAAPIVATTVYRLNGIPYLPHYRQPVYVAPGHVEKQSREFTEQELLDAGAVAAREFLWDGAATSLRGSAE